MVKTDYSSPLPKERLIARFKHVFEKLNVGQSATLLALPFTGRTSNLRYLANNKLFLDKNVAFFDIDKTTGTYESFISELIFSISGQDPKSYQDAYLLNKELFGLIAEITKKSEIILILTLNEKALPILNEIDQLIAQSQKAATKFPLTILWSIDSLVYRKYVKIHPSSTFGQNLSYFPTFNSEETEYSIKRISVSKSMDLKREKVNKSFETTGGIAGLFHSFVAEENLWDSSLVQQILKILSLEIEAKKSIIDKLISPSGIKLIKDHLNESYSYKSVNLLVSPRAQEINLLKLFLEKDEEPVSRDEIAQILWGKAWNSKYSDWAIDKAISRLRKNIKDNEIKIVTVKNLGYQLFKLS